jgi:hypothetical protein
MKDVIADITNAAKTVVIKVYLKNSIKIHIKNVEIKNTALPIMVFSDRIILDFLHFADKQAKESLMDKIIIGKI